MRSNWFKAGTLVALTGACLWFTPGIAEAQRRGGGGGSRGGVVVQTPGGFSVGVGNTGRYGGYGSGYGGYGSGYGGYGYGSGYGGYGYDRGYRGGYYDRGYYDRGYSPRYSYYGSPSYYSPAYSYSYPSTTYSTAPATSYYEAETPTRDNATAQIMVHVPANAEVWLDGQPTSQRGMERTFVTPRLNSGRTYTYEVKARWMDNGQPVEQTRTVRFQTGQTVHVDFNR